MKHRKKILIFSVIILLLIFSFRYGGNAPSLRGWKADVENDISSPFMNEEYDATYKEEERTENEISQLEEKEPEVKEEIFEKEEKSKEIEKNLSCTLSVTCNTVFDNISWMDPEKLQIIPKDGVIYSEKTVAFFDGESVFDLLLREMKNNKIHMEFENTPIYNTSYIEGIGNLYEFDCGELSGWMYKVNGHFPNFGCSLYTLKDGDRVEWVYTCDLGADVGGGHAAE